MRVSGRGQRVPWSAKQNREAWGKPYARRRRRPPGRCRPPNRPTTLPRRGLLPSRATAAPARLRRAYAIPRAPRLAWPVLHPPYGRARATPAATWSARSTAPRRAASARLAPSLRSVTSLAVDAHDVPLRGW